MDDDKTEGLDPDSTDTVGHDSSDLPERVGPYRILERLGEGGMGVVYLAEQTEGVRRKVALKIIKHGMDTARVVARFEAERQALAMMDHPCVAKVFDAGSTKGGRPYFAMEYVQGVAITDHCDTQRLTTLERLELFQQVCEGVQHAHQNAIIHRDLKPSNVLVSYLDGKATPKIIDFGVAKAIKHRLTEKTLYTEMGVLIGTPEYMSPEQAEMSGQDVDTRTDVYALGVVLYELLVGALPFESKELRRAGFDEIRRKIREEEPSKPSTRLSTLDGTRSMESAKQRRTDPANLRRQLSGDLDWITMKALEKERARRYGSPSELAADLERHMQSQPVLASPPSAVYRAKKFAKRHSWGVGAALVGVLVLVAFAATMAFQANRIRAERDLAKQAQVDLESVVEFQAAMLSETDPEEMGRQLMDDLSVRLAEVLREGGSTETQVASAVSTFDALVRGVNATDLALELVDKNILSRAVSKLDEKFGDQPLIDARLRATIADTYRELGRYERAERQLEAALETRKRSLGEDHPDTLRSMIKLANIYQRQGRYAEAEPLFLAGLESQKRVLGTDHPDTLGAMNNLAILYWNQGRYTDAEPLLLAAIETQKRRLGDNDPITLKTINNLALLYLNQERYAEAESLLLSTVETQKRVLGEDDPATLKTINNLASLYWNMERYAEAEPLLLATLETRKRMLGDDHPDTLVSVNNLASLYQKQDRYAEAEPLALATLETQKRVLGNDHPDTLRSMINLAGLYSSQGRHTETESLFRSILEAQERVLGNDHPDTLGSMNRLAWFQLTREPADSRDPHAALNLALEVAERTGYENPGWLDTLSLAYHLTGDTAKAIENQNKAIALLTEAESGLRAGMKQSLATFEAALESGRE